MFIKFNIKIIYNNHRTYNIYLFLMGIIYQSYARMNRKINKKILIIRNVKQHSLAIIIKNIIKKILQTHAHTHAPTHFVNNNKENERQSQSQKLILNMQSIEHKQRK